jgi:REP element-mobilizing transposase RayT
MGSGLAFCLRDGYIVSMSRPLRVEFPGALYHVTARGDRREPIFEDDEDRRALLEVLSRALERFDASYLAYCLMSNHYHFVLETHRANLSRLMRHVNGVYTQRCNRRHQRVGHLFQGRFKAILVDRDAYLLEVCRYVDLNPVRARLVKRAEDWAWSPPSLLLRALPRYVFPNGARVRSHGLDCLIDARLVALEDTSDQSHLL